MFGGRVHKLDVSSIIGACEQVVVLIAIQVLVVGFTVGVVEIVREVVQVDRFGIGGFGAALHEPLPVAEQFVFVEGEIEGTLKFVSLERTFAEVGAVVEEGTVTGILEVSVARADKLFLGHLKNFAGSRAGRRPRRPVADFVLVVEDKTGRASVLELLH